MQTTQQQWQPTEGMDVFGADGDKLGKIVAISTSSIVVEKGFFFPKDYYIPRSAIANVEGDSVYLLVGKDEALNSGWDQDALAAEGNADGDVNAPTSTGLAAGAGGTAIPTTGGDPWLGTTERSDLAAGMASQEDSALATGTAAGGYDATRVSGEATGTIGRDVDVADSGTSQASDTMRVPVHEEELTATKRPVEYGDVRIEKDVVEEPRSIDVPITEERVRVTRRTVDRDADSSTAFQEDSIEVPVRGEEVDVQKRTRVAEEVEIAKEQVQRTVHADDTVRREKVDVVDDTATRGSGDAAS